MTTSRLAGKVRVEPVPLTAERIPTELLYRPQWVAWHFGPRPERSKPSKVPINPATGRPASPTAPSTWGSFDDALSIATKRRLSGVGFVFTPADPFAGVDLDDCRDPATGRLDPWAEEIVASLASYTEVSPSGTGIKAFLRAKLPGDRHRKGHVELYDRGRFFTVTGWKLDTAPDDVRPGQAAIDALYRELFDRDVPTQPATPPVVTLPDDADLIGRAMRARNRAKFSQLWAGNWSAYATHSEADLALCGILAFWTGGDPNRIDRLFRQSGLWRAKWDERRGPETYGQRTILRGVQGCTKFYTAAHGQSSCSASPRVPKIPNRVHNVSFTRLSPSEQRNQLFDHVRSLRKQLQAPVPLSARQAKNVVGVSTATANRRLAELVANGRLVLVAKGFWDSRKDLPGAPSRYDIAESQPTLVVIPPANAPTRPTTPPTHTSTRGGMLAVWRWRRGKWQHYGDCNGRDAAAALVGRHMGKASCYWSVGDELWHYSRGRGLRVRKWPAEAIVSGHSKGGLRA